MSPSPKPPREPELERHEAFDDDGEPPPVSRDADGARPADDEPRSVFDPGAADGEPAQAARSPEDFVPRWVTAWREGWRNEGASYWLTRFAILRLLGLVYFVAFLGLAQQLEGLIGEDGITPVGMFLDRVYANLGWVAPVRLPTIFWIAHSDAVLLGFAYLGVVLSLLVLFGYANSIIMIVLWAVYLSFVHVGQIWYSFGWEMQLCETGFLAVFLVPLLDPRPFPRRPPPTPVIWLFRWLIVRIMLGAGLIKIRGDECWRNLTCLDTHFETQPVPGPLSPMFHFAPAWTHKLGVVFNHAVELVAPFFAFGPRRARHIAGGVMLLFQVFLILSGNLSFLNWLTMVPILACFDDSLWRRILPKALVRRAERAAREAEPSRPQRRATIAVFALVGILSVAPVANLLSSDQAMNTSFEPFELVNTYGAFGSVGKLRNEIVFEGTNDATLDANTEWKAYEFECKPGDVMRRPCWITPYHYRLDWLIWFAAMSSPRGHPWVVKFVAELLEGNPNVIDLLETNPFPDHPPKYIRATLYRYEFAPPGSGAVWKRTRLGPWLPPVSADSPALHEFLWRAGLVRAGD